MINMVINIDADDQYKKKNKKNNNKQMEHPEQQQPQYTISGQCVKINLSPDIFM